MTYYLETYGCQMNKAESAAMESLLAERLWNKGDIETSELVVINTCTVRATAENRAWGRIAQFVAEKKKRRFALMVVGCMAEQYREDMRKKEPGIDYVLGTFQKQAFGLVLDQIQAGTAFHLEDESPSYVFSKTHHEPGAFRSFVPIMHGCDNFCSYCIVPHVRGREISRNPADILAELDELRNVGVREVTLLGQNVNSYKWKDGTQELDFPDLLALIASHLETGEKGKGIGWIRFLTSHPKDLSDKLISIMAREPVLCRHIHLCLQSGSNRVLAAMNRKYTMEYFLELVRKLKTSIPGLSLSTDILVGFPGETDEDLEDTLDAMAKVGFAYSFMYHFNPRAGTPAALMEGRVPEKTKKTRLARVIELQKSMTETMMDKRLGMVDEVLVEGPSRRSPKEMLGRTARDEMVVFSADSARVGHFVRVRLLSRSGNTFRAEEVDA